MKRFLTFFLVICWLSIVSYNTYWKNYWKPEVFFWDENYHIASAAKYIKGVFFMEPHPPLGKLLIAAGEKILNINDGQTFNFEKYDIIPHEIQNPAFSFAGYRLLPSIFSTLNVFLFTGILFLLTHSWLLTLSLSSLILFDSALILHSRGAMLEPFLIFGTLIAIASYLKLLKLSRAKPLHLIALTSLMSFGVAFAFMTKIFGFALLVLWPLLFVFKKELKKEFSYCFPINFLLMFFFSLFVWVIHFNLGKKVEPSLMHNGLYLSSNKYEKIILGLEKDSFSNLPLKLREHIRYIFHYSSNVEALDMSQKNVTGSYPIMWPFGSRAISYRWQNQDNKHRYLYLVPNPWTWFCGLIGILCSFVFIFHPQLTLSINKKVILSLFILYVSFWLPMNFISRVLYLYHYFPMLIISWLLLSVLIQDLIPKKTGLQKKLVYVVIFMCPFFSFLGYHHYKNFIFYTPLSCYELKNKFSLPFWGLKFPSCDLEKNKNLNRLKFKDSFIL